MRNSIPVALNTNQIYILYNFQPKKCSHHYIRHKLHPNVELSTKYPHSQMQQGITNQWQLTTLRPRNRCRKCWLTLFLNQVSYILVKHYNSLFNFTVHEGSCYLDWHNLKANLLDEKHNKHGNQQKCRMQTFQLKIEESLFI